MTESNAAKEIAQTRKQKAENWVDFCHVLAKKMLTNNSDDDEKIVFKIVWPVTSGSLEVGKMEHKLEKRLGLNVPWDENAEDWAAVNYEYQKSYCATP